MNKIIEDFVEQYKIEYDHYYNLSKITYEICEEKLISQGIKAITSFRPKSPNSLKEKLYKRNKSINYDSISSIKKDICDLAGVRIALYFPTERVAVDKIINEYFNVITKKVFPDSNNTPSYKKRFSGYWANHYRVNLLDKKDYERYANSIIEIQVASVLMHAWSEIEHDLVYKPNSGDLSTEENEILDEINGLVIVGEIALERLQKVMINRIEQKDKFDNSYELKNYLNKYIKDINNKNIGDIKLLNKAINTINFKNKNQLRKIINNLVYYEDDSIADEILEKVITEKFKEQKNINKYISELSLNKNNNLIKSHFELFIKLWILFEKINEYFLQNRKSQNIKKKYDIYLNTNTLDKSEISTLYLLRNTRNEILHGIGMYDEERLKKYSEALKNILTKIIDKIKEKDVRDAFKNEFNHITTTWS